MYIKISNYIFLVYLQLYDSKILDCVFENWKFILLNDTFVSENFFNYINKYKPNNINDELLLTIINEWNVNDYKTYNGAITSICKLMKMSPNDLILVGKDYNDHVFRMRLHTKNKSNYAILKCKEINHFIVAEYFVSLWTTRIEHCLKFISFTKEIKEEYF